MESQNHLSDCQFGFRINRSTADCIFILKSIIDCSINSRKNLYCTFIDFRKAFDLVYRNGIWVKLLDMGISNKFINMIRKMYESVKVCMRSLHTLSDFFDSHVGVKQGEPLSPLLFIIFINDIASDIANTNISAHTITQIQIYMLLFADDTVLFAESQKDMQALLDKLYQYCCKWYISVNIDKTKTMVFKSGNRHENVVLRYAGSLLTNVKSFTYLGLTLSSNGKFY